MTNTRDVISDNLLTVDTTAGAGYVAENPYVSTTDIDDFKMRVSRLGPKAVILENTKKIRVTNGEQNTTIRNIYLGDEVDEVLSDSFKNCINLETADLGGALSVDDNAFYNCNSLTTVTANNLKYIGDSAFKYVSLLDISFPSVLSVGAEAFGIDNQYGAETINMPLATYIGDMAFAGHKHIKSLNIPNANYIKDNAFDSAVINENNENSNFNLNLDKVIEIGHSTFYNSIINTDTIDLPALTKIGKDSFDTCSGFKHLKINKLKSIDFGNGTGNGEVKFTGNSSLIDAELKGLNTIICNINDHRNYGFLFSNNQNVKKINLENLQNIISKDTSGGSNFAMCYKCPKLSSINLNNLATITCDGEMEIIATNDELKNINLPKLTSINTHVRFNNTGIFQSCTGLSSIRIPKLITFAGRLCNNCNSLVSVDIPSSCDFNGGTIFNNCSGSLSVSLGLGSKLNSKIFCNCANINTIIYGGVPEIGTEDTSDVLSWNNDKLMSKQPIPFIAKDAIDETTPHKNIRVIVPPGMYHEFKNADVWNTFNVCTTRIIEEAHIEVTRDTKRSYIISTGKKDIIIDKINKVEGSTRDKDLTVSVIRVNGAESIVG